MPEFPQLTNIDMTPELLTEPVDTIVLDIGNVVCEWNPQKLIRMSYPLDSEPTQASVQQAIMDTVGDSDWLALDRGVLALDDGIARAVARSDLDAEWISAIYHNMPVSLTPLPDTVTAMHEASASGYKIHILSNMPAHAAEYLLRTHAFFSLAENIILSCECHLMKPEHAIYQHLIDTCSLEPGKSVFIDDMAENVEAAKACGLQSLQLTDPNEGGQLIRQLIAVS